MKRFCLFPENVKQYVSTPIKIQRQSVFVEIIETRDCNEICPSVQSDVSNEMSKSNRVSNSIFDRKMEKSRGIFYSKILFIREFPFRNFTE